MKRRTAIWSMIVGWLCSLFGWPKRSVATPVEEMVFLPDRIQGPTSYFDLRVENATSGALKPVLDSAYNQGWCIHSMDRDKLTKLAWNLRFYRPATDGELLECEKKRREACEPQFEGGCKKCRWCGGEGLLRQVPASISTDDIYCRGCAEKCSEYYWGIIRDARKSQQT